MSRPKLGGVEAVPQLPVTAGYGLALEGEGDVAKRSVWLGELTAPPDLVVSLATVHPLQRTDQVK